jgi:glutamate dehydrogenase/leucine dehydrogenase
LTVDGRYPHAPDVTPVAINNLARGMTLKNAAADLPYGGGKSGIVAPRNLSPGEHNEVIRRFAICSTLPGHVPARPHVAPTTPI